MTQQVGFGSRRSCIIASASNVLAIVILGVPALVMEYDGSPHIRGFDPADSTIALPFKDDTIEAGVAVAVCIILSFTCFVIIEIAIVMWLHPSSAVSHNKKRQLFLALAAITRISMAYFAGFALTATVTNMIKYLVARPRPCFLEMCKPNYALMTVPACQACGAGPSAQTLWPLCPDCPYIQPSIAMQICNQSDSYIAKDMWLSFPSGHSSCTFYPMTFLAIYLYSRLCIEIAEKRCGGSVADTLWAARPLAVWTPLCFSTWVALSRVQDDKHRVSDVIAGSAIGVAIAFLCAVPSLKRIVSLSSLFGSANSLLIARDRNASDVDQQPRHVDLAVRPISPANMTSIAINSS